MTETITAPEQTTTQLALAKPLSELTTFSDFMSIAGQLINTAFCPKYIDSVETMASILLYGKELGIAPMSALNNIISIQGKLSLTSAAMLAQVRKFNMRIKLTEDFVPVMGEMYKNPQNPAEGTVQGIVDYRTTVEFWEMWNGEILKNSISSLWTELVAAATENGTKQLPLSYIKYRKQMQFARTVTRGVRAFIPDAIQGQLYSDVELAMEEGRPVRVVDGTLEVVPEGAEREGEDVEYDEMMESQI